MASDFSLVCLVGKRNVIFVASFVIIWMLWRPYDKCLGNVAWQILQACHLRKLIITTRTFKFLPKEMKVKKVKPPSLNALHYVKSYSPAPTQTIQCILISGKSPTPVGTIRWAICGLAAYLRRFSPWICEWPNPLPTRGSCDIQATTAYPPKISPSSHSSTNQSVKDEQLGRLAANCPGRGFEKERKKKQVTHTYATFFSKKKQ